MKTIKKILLILGLPVLALAQTAMSSTTLSSAVAVAVPGSGSTFVIVASATNIQAPSASAPGSILFVDAEAMRVTSVNGTNIGVVRGTDGTRSTGHLSGAVVWFATPGSTVTPADGFISKSPQGTCVVANTFTPTIDLLTGTQWVCATTALSTTGNGLWQTISTYEMRPVVGKAITAATTIAPQTAIVHVTGTTAIATITVPPACADTGCVIYIIFDGVPTWTAGGNISITSAAWAAWASSPAIIAGTAVPFVYDPVTTKWYPIL
jgi:hypothetical protein